MQFQNLLFEKKDDVGVLFFNRPTALNALNSQVLNELQAFLNHVDEDRGLRCLILTGSGDKAFVAGADIKELASLSSSEAKSFAEKGQKVFRRLEILKIPVIAAVNGFALGGGCELALACDFIVASQKAKFGLPEVSLGLIPGFGGTQRLIRQVGISRARELIFTGRQVNAQEALEIGIAMELCEPEKLLEVCFAKAHQIATRSPFAVSKSKEAINRGADSVLDEGLMIERELFSELYTTNDVREGTSAFLEKRTPVFKGWKSE
jgi:enoyl-CoA hydratase